MLRLIDIHRVSDVLVRLAVETDVDARDYDVAVSPGDASAGEVTVFSCCDRLEAYLNDLRHTTKYWKLDAPLYDAIRDVYYSKRGASLPLKLYDGDCPPLANYDRIPTKP